MEMSAQVQTSSLTSRLYIDQILLPTTQVAILEICSKFIFFSEGSIFRKQTLLSSSKTHLFI